MHRVFLSDPTAVSAQRGRLTAAHEQLTTDADAALSVPPQSVMQKSILPPSGDKHDYVSLAKYWWPDPSNLPGPYIRRDGEINPEWQNYDRIPLGKMHTAVTALALASHFTTNEQRATRYAQHAALLLRTWFLDPATRMNPHVRFGQFVPRVVEGRGMGIIDTFPLTRMLDALVVMPDSADHGALRDWFARYLDWLLTSDRGREEAASMNNHGNWYDVQVVYYLLYLDRPDEAAAILRSRVIERMNAQIAPDGSQPQELRRTLAFGYSVFNLLGFMQLAWMAEHASVALWNYRRSGDAKPIIQLATDWLLPYCRLGATWPYQQIVKFETSGEQDRLIHVLRFAELKYGGGEYERTLQTRTDLKPERDRMNLLHPTV